MHIAITNDLHANGGAVALMAWRMTKALKDAGHDATLITGQGADPLPTDIPVIGWRYPERTSESLFAMIRFYQKLRAQSGEAFGRWFQASPKKPDLWVSLVIPSALGALDGGGRRLPLLYVCNSPWAMEWVSAYRASTGYEPTGLARMAGVLPRRRAERTIVSRARAWTALSQIQLDWFMAEHPRCGDIPKRVISGAVDTSQRAPLPNQEREAVLAREGIKSDERLLICSRRLVPRTGVDLLLEALKDLPPTVKLVITGDGPKREELEQQSKSLGLRNRVRFTGFIQPHELAQLTSAAHAAVLPTRELEGFGLSAAEALSAGTPVVATPVGALVDVIGGLDKNLLSADVSKGALAAAIRWALKHATAEAYRKRCRTYVIERYDWGKLKHEFVGLCEQTAGQGAVS